MRLASSKACVNQAFQIGKKVIGMQFHLEATRESVKLLIDNCNDELVKGGKYVQSGSALKKADDSFYVSINSVMAQVLTYLAPA